MAWGRPAADAAEQMKDEQRDQRRGPLSPVGTNTESSTIDSDVPRQELQRVSAEFNQANSPNTVYWRQHGSNALNHSSRWLRKRSTSVCTGAARDQTDMSVAHATAHTHAIIIADLLRSEQTAGTQVPLQHMQLLNEVNAVAENTTTDQRVMLSTGAVGETHKRSCIPN